MNVLINIQNCKTAQQMLAVSIRATLLISTKILIYLSKCVLVSFTDTGQKYLIFFIPFYIFLAISLDNNFDFCSSPYSHTVTFNSALRLNSLQREVLGNFGLSSIPVQIYETVIKIYSVKFKLQMFIVERKDLFQESYIILSFVSACGNMSLFKEKFCFQAVCMHKKFKLAYLSGNGCV